MIGVQIAFTAAVLLGLFGFIGSEADIRGWDWTERFARFGVVACVIGIVAGFIIAIWSL